jgi:hypothetical protein
MGVSPEKFHHHTAQLASPFLSFWMVVVELLIAINNPISVWGIVKLGRCWLVEIFETCLSKEFEQSI